MGKGNYYVIITSLSYCPIYSTPDWLEWTPLWSWWTPLTLHLLAHGLRQLLLSTVTKVTCVFRTGYVVRVLSWILLGCGVVGVVFCSGLGLLLIIAGFLLQVSVCMNIKLNGSV